MLPEAGVPKSPITGVPGWEEDVEEMMLGELATRVPKDGLIVELGAEYGRSAAVFCKYARPSVNILSIDLFPEDHSEVGDLLAAYLANLRDAGFEGRTSVLRSDSGEAGAQWSGGQVDLLFVDADHTLAGVTRDIEAWADHVKPGGYVAFHDCAYRNESHEPHALHEEVSLAVDGWAFSEGWEFLGQWASLRAYRRPR